MGAVDGEEKGEWQWEQSEEKTAGSIESVGKENPNTDEEGYETVRRPRPRTLGQYMPEIFTVEAEKLGNSEDKELSKMGDSIKEASKKKENSADMVAQRKGATTGAGAAE